MGFNLGMAAYAYQGAKAEQRRLDEDAFVQAQRAYQQANMDEYQSRRGMRDNAAGLADDRVTADRTVLPAETELRQARVSADAESLPAETELRQGRTAAGLELLPQQTAVQAGALDEQAHNQELAKSLRGVTDETARTNAATAGVTAKNAKSHADIVNNMTEADKIANAAEIDGKIAKSAEYASETRANVLADIYTAGTTGKTDEHAIVDRLNVLSYSSLFPALKGKKVADIKVEKTPDGDVMALYDKDKNRIMNMPVSEMQAAVQQRAARAKPIVVPNGAQLYRPDGGGGLTKIADNPKPAAGGAAGGAARSSMQERLATKIQAEYKAKTGKDLSTAEALQIIKGDPEKYAVQLDKADQRLQYETDPAKRRAIQNENRRTVGAKPVGESSPGLGAANPSAVNPGIIDQWLGAAPR